MTANVALMGTSAYLISKAALVTEVATLTIAVTSVRLFAILRAGSRYGERLLSHDVAFRIVTNVRGWFYESIEPLAPARLSRHRSGDLLSRSLTGVETIEGFYVHVAHAPAAAVFVAAGTCLFLAVFDWRLGLTLAAFLLLAGVVLPVALWRLARGASARLAGARGRLSALLVDQTEGVADLLVFDAARLHASQVAAAGAEVARLQQKLALVRGIGNAAGALLASLAMLAILVLGVQLVNRGEVAGVYLALLPLVALASFEAVQQMSRAVQHLDASIEAGKRVFELVDTPPDVCEPRVPAPLPQRYNVEFRDVCFRYHPGEPLVLEDLSFEIGSGEKVALAGDSGSGKTTIVNVLLRFWEYERGTIRLGGGDLRDDEGESLRSLIAVVPQDVYLFNTTLRDNLLLARPEATDAEVGAVCRAAQLHEMIASLPQGYDTLTGENGLRLSGGERQRLAIARALLKDAPILVLDEPTANLDAETERRLLASLQPFLAGKTALLISHRPAVWACADRVIELRDGRATTADRRPGGESEAEREARLV